MENTEALETTFAALSMLTIIVLPFVAMLVSRRIGKRHFERQARRVAKPQNEIDELIARWSDHTDEPYFEADSYDGTGGVYLIARSELGQNFVKVGIGNDLDRRVRQHARQGWMLVRSYQIDTEAEARRVEREAHAALAGHKPDPQTVQMLRSSMPQGGFTEVFSAEIFEALDIVERIATRVAA